MIWGFFALLAGLTYCIQSETNKHFKVDGFELNTYRSLISVVLLLPLIPLMEWPRIPEYYLVLLLEASISVVCMMAQYNLSAKKNGRIACLHQPIAILLTFMIWFALSPEQRAVFFAHPEKAIYIGTGFILFFFGLQTIRKNDAGWAALLAVMPIAVLYSIMAVVSKIALEQGEDMFGISLNFVFLCNVLMFLLSAPIYYGMKKASSIPKKTLFKASAYVAVAHSLSWFFFCLAVILTPNPAYVGVITGLAPLWFLLYYKIRKIDDDASPVGGLIIGAAAILILFSSN